MKYVRMWMGMALAITLWAGASSAYAGEPLDLSATRHAPIGMHISILQEDSVALDLAGARQALADGRFQPAVTPMMSFGIDASPVWLAFDAVNLSAQTVERNLLVEVAWIDQIDVYFLHGAALNGQHRVGDRLPFAERPVEARYFDIPHQFLPGTTTVLLRVQSVDPTDLPIYVVTPQQAATRVTVEAYTYGFVYGAILALLGYNFILFLKLRRARYAYYALYLSFFIAMNASYTGHGFWLLWPEHPIFQQWIILSLMVAYGLSGLAFAASFLETKRHFPRLHRAVLISALTFVGLEGASAIASSHASAAWVAFTFALFFAAMMVLLGSVAVLARIVSAKYFLTAALAAATGAALTAVTVLGVVPFSVWGYRAVEIGMMIDAVLLALALADQFRVNEEQKTQAQALARLDPLTELNNRRGFYDLAAPVWSTGLRHKRSMSVILLDLDHFKAFNDSFGHAMGDQALQAVARAIKKTARSGDIAARWGGEEFILFLPETSQNEAVAVASRLLTDIKTMVMDHAGEEVRVTASIGIAERDAACTSFDALVEVADRRLFTAKQEGRDRLCAA